MVDSSRVDPERYLRPGFRFFTATPTRWGDCDMFGHVNNVQFVRYYESGRLDYFHRLLDMIAGPEVHNSLIIADIHVSFLRQIHHPCALEVGSRISRLGNSSFDFEAAIFAPGDEQPFSTAKAACVWFNYRENRSIPIPARERGIIQQFEGIDS
ncbi:MAG: acyl-CoA thioesterase [Gammaproteobacteria bacterium]|nr:acyl-CoA thioesterase [Gammaproteobacteria bacterium]MDH3449754.1 acyl-CoA thioesterase [Gammaproteobacteria bacterium]